jgi:hypothetical protein
MVVWFVKTLACNKKKVFYLYYCTLATGEKTSNLRTDTVTCFLWILIHTNYFVKIAEPRDQQISETYYRGRYPHTLKLAKFLIKGGPSSTPVYLFQVLFMTKSHIDCDIKNNISINICVFSCDVIFSLFLSYTFFYSSQKYLTSRFGHFFLTIFSLFLS